MNRTFTKVAVAAAAAMTLSLAAPISAHAAESGSATGKLVQAPAGAAPAAAPTASAAASSAPAAISLRLYRGASFEHRLSSSRDIASSLATSVSVAPGFNISTAVADVYVAGRRKGTISIPWYTTNTGFETWPRGYGFGTTQLRNVRVTGWHTGSAGTTVSYSLPGASNAIRVKRTINPSAYLKISKRGSKAVAKASTWRVHQPNGSQIRVSKKVKLQRKVKGKWRNYKNIKLNSKGTGKIKFKQKKKYNYRILVPSTTTVQGAYTRPFKI